MYVVNHHREPCAEGPRLRLGVVGMGRGFMAMLPTLVRHPRLEIVAGTDPRPEARARFGRDFGASVYDDFETMCRASDVQAVYIASPHQYHRAQVEIAARYGLHVLVEKPMALELEDCFAMNRAMRNAGVSLLVGHSHGFDAPIARAHRLIQSGAYGRLRMITALNFTDFLYRPRREEELRTTQGGGVVLSQASHQVDIVRLLGGGRVATVRAQAGSWDSRRPTESAYSALLTFENGVVASLVYSGHAHFDSDEFCGNISETGRLKTGISYGAARQALRQINSPEEEAAVKRDRGYGGSAYTAPDLDSSSAPRDLRHEHFGLIIASCEGADLRPGPDGVAVYADEQQHFDVLPPPSIPRREVVDELVDAVFTDKPVLHSGEWGTANLEVCLAILASGEQKRDIELHHQVAVGRPIDDVVT